MAMSERSMLDTVQRWRRKKYSARPFALTILAIALMTLLAWAKEEHGRGASAAERLRTRDLTVLDEEVGKTLPLRMHPSNMTPLPADRPHSAGSSTMPPTSAPSSSQTAPTRRPASSRT